MLKRLEAHHLIALKWLALPKRGGKTMNEIAEEASVTRGTLYDWIKDPLFDKELKKEIIRETMNRLPEVLASLTDAVVNDHNAAAAKLLLQVNGMLTDKIEVDNKGTGITDIDALRTKLELLHAKREDV